MFKKLAVFLFTAAAALSASISIAAPGACLAQCRLDYSDCLDAGIDPAACRRELLQCNRDCRYPPP
ncbi:hypothetical protein MJ904_11480 [Massilia sp. MB5]|uniref:hypothetical protein n=1 Tax=unclassified Massilia TaxID=2609279 RepID=UPI00067A8BB8|nr:MULTISPECIES: hypothetical protein [unclassified Massilia]AKU22491.1 hypothetical protein ACZ75_14445 [Massilia sp. NR 4-1]UMR32723.1 hypothetical protein MJ904_11480 [Massilia sp. MB5]